MSLWFEAHAQKLVGATQAQIEEALQAAYNEGLHHARDICSGHEVDCKSSQQLEIVRNISTHCLHAMVHDGDTMEPVQMKTFETPQ
jgi:hypothetical protein